MIRAGQVVQIGNRIYKIDELHFDEDKGSLHSITAICLTPQDGDESVWFNLEVNDEDAIVAHTVH